MTPELIASIVAVPGALTAYLKAHSESTDIVRSREATKQEPTFPAHSLRVL